MYAFWRNIHLGLGLVFVLGAMMFALSSLTIIYRPWLPEGASDSELAVELSGAATAEPRALARELMENHALRGELRQIQTEGDKVSFRIVRPGETADVAVSRSSGRAEIKLRRLGFLETLVQLHTNVGLWHEFAPSNAWAMLSFLTSIGLMLLGGTGVYLWFARHTERVLGSVLLGSSLLFGFISLLATRLDQ